MSKNNGGPALPEAGERGKAAGGEGMTLRDYFAGKALSGICASGPGKSWSNQMLAAEAYHLADAMLAEREREQ